MKKAIHDSIEQISVNMRDDIYVIMYLVRGEQNVLIDTGVTPKYTFGFVSWDGRGNPYLL
jgi:flavorubredoxin